VSRVVRHVWGWVLLLLGIIGLIMPVMPGWVFLIPGLVILSDYFEWARRLTAWAKAKAHWVERGIRNGKHTGGGEAGRKDPGDD
jgi:uncharacterized membrane protein YbaN (DUF454 family)